MHDVDKLYDIGSNATLRQEYIESAVGFVFSRHLDGMDLFFPEMPRFENSFQ